jgi:hypothetical protein
MSPLNPLGVIEILFPKTYRAKVINSPPKDMGGPSGGFFGKPLILYI